MSIGYKISETDLSDIKNWVQSLDSPETIESFKIWPADVEGKCGVYISIERKDSGTSPDLVRTSDTAFGSFPSVEARKAFIGKLAVAFVQEQLSFKIDYEIGQRLIDLWSEIRSTVAKPEGK